MTFVVYNQPMIVKLGSRLDLEAGDLLKQQVTESHPGLDTLWVIDMGEVEFVNSAGLSALVRGFNLAKQQGGRLIICNVPCTARMILEITQLDRVFEIWESVEGFLKQYSELPERTLACA